MSRVGKKPIPLPKGVKVTVGGEMLVEGPKGKLNLELHRRTSMKKGKVATFTLGYSHPIEVLLPEGVDLKIDKQTHLVLSGYDKQMVGQVAANIRALRPPDPYKNKGIRYTGEALRKKVGKTGAAAGAK
jgi:large subunit ribosomal protein L6